MYVIKCFIAIYLFLLITTSFFDSIKMKFDFDENLIFNQSEILNEKASMQLSTAYIHKTYALFFYF